MFVSWEGIYYNHSSCLTCGKDTDVAMKIGMLTSGGDCQALNAAMRRLGSLWILRGI